MIALRSRVSRLVLMLSINREVWTGKLFGSNDFISAYGIDGVSGHPNGNVQRLQPMQSVRMEDVNVFRI